MHAHALALAIALATLRSLLGKVNAMSATVREGLLPFSYQGENLQTYYKVIGDHHDHNHTPVVVLHGGPGLSHDYLLPHADLSTLYGSRLVILYDQIGNARSTHLPDKPSTFWTVDLFLDELTNLLEYFGIQKEFHLIGHSWGGMMGAEFVARRHPAGLRRLVIADSPAAFDLWTRSFRELVGGFPQHVQDALAKEVDEDRQPYFAAMLQVYAVHGCRVHPFPDELIKTLQYQYADDADRTVTDAGIIKNWTIIDRLHLVNVPTLIVNGQYDIAQDYVVEAYAEKIPDSRRLKFNSASHTPFWEDREAYMEAIAGFLSQ